MNALAGGAGGASGPGGAGSRGGGFAERVQARLVIRGRVQGVGFRFYARREASRLRLDGWVRNRADGSLELVAQGPRRDVEAMIAWSRHGPSHARVEEVEVAWEPVDAGLGAFEIEG